jgi:hypothetical protein
MSKLTAAIRNHFVLVPDFEAEAPPFESSTRNLAPVGQSPGAYWRLPNVVVPKLSAGLRTPLHPAELEAMNISAREPHPSDLTKALLPDSAFASLAGKAPAVCSQLQRMGR